MVASMKMPDWERQAILQSCHDILDEPPAPTRGVLSRNLQGLGQLITVEQPRQQKPVLQEQSMGDEFV